MNGLRPRHDQCIILDLSVLLTEIRLVWVPHGSVTWPRGQSVSFQKLKEHRWARCLELLYTAGPDNVPLDLHESIHLEIPIVEKSQPFGGCRYYGRCPTFDGVTRCNRPVTKLYLPRGELRFGCQQCHRVDYAAESRRRAEKRQLKRHLQDAGIPAEYIRGTLAELYPDPELQIAPRRWNPKTLESTGLFY